MYLLDSSDPVTPEYYNNQKVFVKSLARYLDTMPSRSRGAVITYGSTSAVVSNLGDTTEIQDFESTVNNASKIGGQRRIDRAIDAARNVFRDARPAIPKVVILLATGNQSAEVQVGALDKAFQRLYELGARLYAVTINAPIVHLPLRSANGSDWFPVASFTDLPVQVMPLARHIATDTGL